MRPRRGTGKTAWKQVTSNALDFLFRAIEEFKAHPKYSVIHFYSAVELLLKARLMHEHWSLVVTKDPDYQSFVDGDFVSVSFDELCKRLKKVAQTAVPEQVQKNFDAMRKHRNKMVHYFHGASIKRGPAMAAIATEQLRAWYDLNKLLSEQWSPIFDEYGTQLARIERKLGGHREYLRAKFVDLAPKLAALNSRGVKIQRCTSCRFKANQVDDIVGDLHESKCLVCGYRSRWLVYKCPGCGAKGKLRDGGRFVCATCGQTLEESDLVESIDQFVATKHNYFEAMVPANCAECDGYPEF